MSITAMKFNAKMTIFTFLVCLIGLVNAIPTGLNSSSLSMFNTTQFLSLDITGPNFTTAGYDPSKEYHYNSVAEVWIGHVPVNTGTCYGGNLYRTAWSAMDRVCDKPNGRCGEPNWTKASWSTLYAVEHSQVREGLTGIQIEHGSWYNDQIRRLLIGIIAGVLEATTQNQHNCYYHGRVKLCNIPDVVRVNLPIRHGVANYLHIRLHGQRAMGELRCCDSRALVDKSIDGYKEEISSVFFGYHRDVRCIIDGWKSC